MSGADREYYERMSFGLTPEGEEYKASVDVQQIADLFALKRYAVIQTWEGKKPRFIGLFDSLEEASEEADRVETEDSDVHIKSQVVKASLEEIATVIRDELIQAADSTEEAKQDRWAMANVFRKEIAEGIVKKDGRYKWLCSCGATGQDLHKTEEKARKALWDHRDRESCPYDGEPPILNEVERP